jgi:hypothetical protein
VPGGNYGIGSAPEHVLRLSLGDSAYPLDNSEIGPGERKLDVDGVDLAVLGDQSLVLAEGERYIKVGLAPGVLRSERQRLLLDLGRPLIGRWLRK